MKQHIGAVSAAVLLIGTFGARAACGPPFDPRVTISVPLTGGLAEYGLDAPSQTTYPVPVTSTFTAPGADPNGWKATWSWRDPSNPLGIDNFFASTNYVSGNTSTTYQAARGRHILTVQPNKVGGIVIGCADTSIRVRNKPTAQLTGPISASTGQSLTYTVGIGIDAQYAPNPTPNIFVNFGDGTTSTQPFGTGAFDINHTFAVAGTFNVSATVNDGYFSAVAQKQVVVSNASGIPIAPNPIGWEDYCQRKVHVQWAAVSGATSYQLFSSGTANFASSTLVYSGGSIGWTAPATTSIKFYRAQACNSSGCSVNSNVAGPALGTVSSC